MPAAPDRPRRSWGRSPNRPSPLPYSDTNFPSTSGALHEGALLADDAAGGLDAAEGLGGAGIRRQLLAVLLVSRQVREVDEAERDVARPRQLARHVVGDALAAAALDVRGQRPDIGLEFGELVVIDGVADSERDHAWSPCLASTSPSNDQRSPPIANASTPSELCGGAGHAEPAIYHRQWRKTS